MRIRGNLLFLAGAAVCCAAAYAGAALNPYTIDAHVIGSGASQRTANACFRLRATIAEPIAGYSSSSDYALEAGFLAHRTASARDEIFFDAFEICPP